MPKKVPINVNGRKIKVIQDNLHMEVFSCRECRESRISTDLYIKSFRLSVGFTKSSCTLPKMLVVSIRCGEYCVQDTNSLHVAGAILKPVILCCRFAIQLTQIVLHFFDYVCVNGDQSLNLKPVAGIRP